MNSVHIIIIAGAVTLLAGAASADVLIDTYPTPSPYPSQNHFTDGFLFTAQTFTPPAENTVLVSWTFELAARYAEPGNVQFSLFEWQAGAPVGPSEFTATVPWPTTVSDPVVSDINLSLTPGKQYGAVIDLLGYSYSSVLFGPDAYSSGNGLWNNGIAWINYPQYDLTFRADFEPTPEPSVGVFVLLTLVLWRMWYHDALRRVESRRLTNRCRQRGMAVPVPLSRRTSSAPRV
jgi:hypothetical protein